MKEEGRRGVVKDIWLLPYAGLLYREIGGIDSERRGKDVGGGNLIRGLENCYMLLRPLMISI